MGVTGRERVEPAVDRAPLRGNVLVVEDVNLMRIIYEEILSELAAVAGSRLASEYVGDGASAVARLGREPPIDLLVVDLYLPGKSGFEVIEYARESNRRILILAISAGSKNDRALAEALGVDAFLQKPFSTDVLKSSIQSLLSSPPILNRAKS